MFKADQLKLIQDVGNAIKGLALWLTILVPVLFALAVMLAKGHRRRTLMTVGFAAIFAGVLVFLARSLLESQVPGALSHDASVQATITDVVSTSTGLLAEVAGAVVFVGAVLVLTAWFAGPARPFVAMRRAMAPFLRDHPVGTYGITLAIMASSLPLGSDPRNRKGRRHRRVHGFGAVGHRSAQTPDGPRNSPTLVPVTRLACSALGATKRAPEARRPRRRGGSDRRSARAPLRAARSRSPHRGRIPIREVPAARRLGWPADP